MLWANMDSIWAEELLRDRHLPPEAIYKLTLLTTGDQRAAESARAKAIVDERGAKAEGKAP